VGTAQSTACTHEGRASWVEEGLLSEHASYGRVVKNKRGTPKARRVGVVGEDARPLRPSSAILLTGKGKNQTTNGGSDEKEIPGEEGGEVRVSTWEKKSKNPHTDWSPCLGR